MAKCKGCGTWIKFIETPQGKKIPVNIDQVAVLETDSNEADTTIVTEEGHVRKGKKLEKIHGDEIGIVKRGYISHFATCPKAKNFRKRK